MLTRCQYQLGLPGGARKATGRFPDSGARARPGAVTLGDLGDTDPAGSDHVVRTANRGSRYPRRPHRPPGPRTRTSPPSPRHAGRGPAPSAASPASSTRRAPPSRRAGPRRRKGASAAHAPLPPAGALLRRSRSPATLALVTAPRATQPLPPILKQLECSSASASGSSDEPLKNNWARLAAQSHRVEAPPLTAAPTIVVVFRSLTGSHAAFYGFSGRASRL